MAANLICLSMSIILNNLDKWYTSLLLMWNYLNETCPRLVICTLIIYAFFVVSIFPCTIRMLCTCIHDSVMLYVCNCIYIVNV